MFAAVEVTDRVADLRLAEPEGGHHRACRADVLLRDAPVRFGHVTHDLEGDAKITLRDRERVAHPHRLALGVATLGRLDGLGVLNPVLRTASLRRPRVARTAVELVIDEVPSDHA